jgi:hypothetical protein
MPPKLVNTKVIRGPFEWEPNVTGDCRPCDVLVPFTYVKNRVYVEADDKNNKNGKKKDKKKKRAEVHGRDAIRVQTMHMCAFDSRAIIGRKELLFFLSRAARRNSKLQL